MNTEVEALRPEPGQGAQCESGKCTNSLDRGYGIIDHRVEGKIVGTTYICLGCSDQRKLDHYKESGELSTWLLLQYSLDKAQTAYLKVADLRLPYDTFMAVDQFQTAAETLITEFRKRHWMGGLCKHIYKARHGLSGTGEGFKVMCLASAGRVLITIEDVQRKAGEGKFGGGTITLIGTDGNTASSLGIQGICATKDEGLSLLWHAVYQMPNLEEDKNIRFG